jgi:hypothetical protein
MTAARQAVAMCSVKPDAPVINRQAGVSVVASHFNISLLAKTRKLVKRAFFRSDIDNKILFPVTLNLGEPIPSLFSGKYFTAMKEHHILHSQLRCDTLFKNTS